MKTLLIYFFTLSIASASVQPQGHTGAVEKLHAPIATGAHPEAARCEPVRTENQPRRKNGTLSPFWAQEYIGGPLARQALARYSEDGSRLQPPMLGVLDSGLHPQNVATPMSERFRESLPHLPVTGPGPSHGTMVTNLIAGAGPVGVGTAFLDFFEVAGNGEGPETLFPPLLQSGVRLVNVSQKWERNAVPPGLAQLSRQAIVVFASGNAFDHPAPRFEGAPDIIQVGSMTPEGMVSSYSQEGEGVDILAPGEFPLETSRDGQYGGFGGTSGAAPLVTGALSNVLSILPDLTASEARLLLRQTAVPTMSNVQHPPRNGAGMVNALKLIEAAIRLKSRGWPAHRTELLQDPTLYNFAETGPEETAVNIQTLLENGRRATYSPNCGVYRAGIADIQRAFLLAAGSPDRLSREIFERARLLLVAKFTEAGLTGNADFYRGLDPRERPRMLAEHMSGSDLEEQRNLGRNLALLPAATAREIFSRALLDQNVEHALLALGVLSNFPNRGSLLAIAYRHPDPRVRRALLEQTYDWREDQRLLRQALQDADPAIRALAAARLGGHGNK